MFWLKRSDFFFFQAEDGIRVLTVTGVQTCALPISPQPRACRPSPPPLGGSGLPPQTAGSGQITCSRERSDHVLSTLGQGRLDNHVRRFQIPACVRTPPPPRALDTEPLPADRRARWPARAPPDLTGWTAHRGQ